MVMSVSITGSALASWIVPVDVMVMSSLPTAPAVQLLPAGAEFVLAEVIASRRAHVEGVEVSLVVSTVIASAFALAANSSDPTAAAAADLARTLRISSLPLRPAPR